jgi:hypothetical protein
MRGALEYVDVAALSSDLDEIDLGRNGIESKRAA